jgi:hypothetical protein
MKRLRKKRKASPVQLSLKHLRGLGWTVCIVEKYNRFAKVRQDAFGFGDILACRPMDGSIALVQTTTFSHLQNRYEKIRLNPKTWRWKRSGGQVILHGWHKISERGKRKTWVVHEQFL